MMEMGEMGEDVAKRASAGSAVPGGGTALGAVGGVVLNLAPEVGRWLFGAGATPAIEAIKKALIAITGSDEPQTQAAILANPEKAAALRVELARIAAEQAAAAAAVAQTALAAQLADVASARSSNLPAVQGGSAIAWGAPVVSVVVLVTFGSVIAMALTHAMPSGAEPVLNVLMGTLGAMATSVVSYWVGSSAGSARKEARLATLADK